MEPDFSRVEHFQERPHVVDGQGINEGILVIIGQLDETQLLGIVMKAVSFRVEATAEPRSTALVSPHISDDGS
jgi:hypothetical protein